MKRMKWNEANLPQAITRINEMREVMNRIGPEAAKIVNGAKITGNKLDKRERDKIQALIKAQNHPKYMRIWLDANYSTGLYLDADISAQVSDYGCQYSEERFCIASSAYGGGGEGGRCQET